MDIRTVSITEMCIDAVNQTKQSTTEWLHESKYIIKL